MMMVSAEATAAAFGNGNDLIVDFVDRRSSEDDADKQTSKMKTEKQVCFSRQVTRYYFQYPDKEELSKRWLSKKEKILVMKAMDHDVQILQCRLTTTPMEEFEKEFLYDCIGLEALVSSEVMRFLKERRRERARMLSCENATLSQRQATCGIFDETFVIFEGESAKDSTWLFGDLVVNAVLFCRYFFVFLKNRD